MKQQNFLVLGLGLLLLLAACEKTAQAEQSAALKEEAPAMPDSDADIGAWREFRIPPAIDFFKYSEDGPQYDASLGVRISNGDIPVARVWGWSKKGKLAYSVASTSYGRGDTTLRFIVFDAVDDKNLAEFVVNSIDLFGEDVEVYDQEQLYLSLKDKILSALKEHEILESTIDFLPFPIKRNNMEYACSLMNIEYHDQSDFGEQFITKYAVLVETSAGNGRVINTFTPRFSNTRQVYICGYIISPFEERVVVVLAEEGLKWDGFSYIFSGCHLRVGF